MCNENFSTSLNLQHYSMFYLSCYLLHTGACSLSTHFEQEFRGIVPKNGNFLLRFASTRKSTYIFHVRYVHVTV